MFHTPSTASHSHCVDPASLHPPHRVLHPSIRLPMSLPLTSTEPPSTHRRGVTGTRKHITVDNLIPLDAPIQPRRYLTPSATSRKDAFQLQQQQQQQQGQGQRMLKGDEEEEDELMEELPASLAAEHQQQIEWRRRKNTLAARKSRQRRLMHQLELEERVRTLSAEKETWKARAQMYEALLRSNGINVPELM